MCPCLQKIPRKWGMTVTWEGQAANIPFKGFCKLWQGQTSCKLVLFGRGAHDDMATLLSCGMDVHPVGIMWHGVGRSQETRGTTVPSHWHMYRISFFFVNVVHGEEKSLQSFFVMILYSSSFSKLCITFSNVNFLSAEQDTMLKSFWIGGKLISLPSDWAVHPSLLAVLLIFIILLVCQMLLISPSNWRNCLSLQTKSWWLVMNMIRCLDLSHNMSRLHPGLFIYLGNPSSQLLCCDPF